MVLHVYVTISGYVGERLVVAIVVGVNCKCVVSLHSSPVLLRLAFLGLGEFRTGILWGKRVEYGLLARLMMVPLVSLLGT